MNFYFAQTEDFISKEEQDVKPSPIIPTPAVILRGQDLADEPSMVLFNKVTLLHNHIGGDSNFDEKYH